jgi:4-hydroxy-2-oxoglutarate aldolase
MHSHLHGILVPVVTPFEAGEGQLAIRAFSENIRAHLAAGCAGIVVAGSTGEAALLDDDERRRLWTAARDVVPADRWLIAGVGAESTRHTIRRAIEASSLGADAVLVVGPHYYPESSTPEALTTHYRAVADASPAPVVLYSIPKYMHYAIPKTVVQTLAGHPHIIGIKDSSGDAATLAGYLEAQSDTFSVLTGHGGSIDRAVAAGVRGGILAVSLFVPALVDAVWETPALQERLTPVAREIVGALGVPGVKAAMDEIGLYGGPLRPPLKSLGDAERARVRELVRAVSEEYSTGMHTASIRRSVAASG